jgi:hypothetical protein
MDAAIIAHSIPGQPHKLPLHVPDDTKSPGMVSLGLLVGKGLNARTDKRIRFAFSLYFDFAAILLCIF